ncbi:pectinesterase [Armillaria luteobubalina]|uniref:Pectinesterase n=1 Tax=Armillaria luteobubalina TaxID=153913 RepID=A0AA39UD50_9AGAR|nr:pectinesterase [Armillaria luteobubalina]
MALLPLQAFAFFSLLLLCARLVYATPAVKQDSHTSAPSGAVVVRVSGAASGEYSTVQAAVDSLDDDGSDQVIFIYAGTYTEQVYIDRDGQTMIMGQTSDTSSYASNTDDFALYNINVKNTFGKASTNGQALALSAYGSNHGYYGMGFYGYQDMILAETGNQLYGYCYIKGAVDYIFGQYAWAYFHYNRIASVAAGAITANGRSSSDGVSLYVINKATITTSNSATSSIEGKVYLGRPWGAYARTGWEEWSSSTPNTDHVTFAEYASTGTGASGTRASFSTMLTSTSGYTISDVLGSDYADWVDSDYL